MKVYSSCKALIIGIGRYADAQHDLSHARSDAEAMAELLGHEFGFDKVWTLYDHDATRQNIIRYFEQDLQRTDEDDGLLIFFAGHGITVTSAIGDDRGFLVPHDGDPKQPYANLSLTTIRDEYLLMIPAKHVFLIVDACYGGLALRDVATVERPKSIDDAVLAELTRRGRKVRQVLAAGTKDQRVLDGGLFGHSVFTGRLIEALREADPYLTADHIGVHVRERVARDGADRRHRQTPQFGYLTGGDGSFVFHRKKAHFVAPSAAPEIRRSPAITSPDVDYLGSLLASHAITDAQEGRILDEWSMRHPKYLSPLCEHAKMERIENLWAIRLEIEILVEDRSLQHEAVPYLPDIHQNIQPFKEDIWAIPFRPPESFIKKEYSHRVSAPDEIAVCGKCNGTDNWVCHKCQGKKEVMCLKCDGTGKDKNNDGTFSSVRECEYCHGARRLPCTTCQGADPHPCPNCGASGKVAKFPVVCVKFEIEKRKEHFADRGIERALPVDSFKGVLLAQRITKGGDIPPVPEYLPNSIKRQMEAVTGKVFHGIAGRIHRAGMSLWLVPFAECHLRYGNRPFTMIIDSLTKSVYHQYDWWIPPNRRRSSGRYIGIPLSGLFGGGVIASSYMTGMSILDAVDGMFLIVGTSLGFLGSLGYLLWALLSKPKPKKGGH